VRWVWLFVAGCRLNFGDASQSADGGADGRADSSADVCSRPTTIVCDDYSAPPTVALSGDAQWISTGGRTGGGLRELSTPTMQSAIHYPLPTTTSGSLYMRAYMNVDPGPAVQMFEVMFELNNAQATGGQDKFSGDLDGGDMFGIGRPSSADQLSSMVVSRGQWVCMELQVDVDPTAGAVRLFVDGTLVTSITNSNTLIPSGFKEALLSTTSSMSDPNFSAVYDDLVVAFAPIGC
jgi:hypothetical protein